MTQENEVVTVDPGIALAKRMRDFADELVDPMVCRQPAGGLGPGTHCAACCYGTGLIITCDEDQALVDAGRALHAAATVLEREGQ